MVYPLASESPVESIEQAEEESRSSLRWSSDPMLVGTMNYLCPKLIGTMNDLSQDKVLAHPFPDLRSTQG